jgi:hypothetical protein
MDCMTSIIKSDIFFFITTIAVIIVTIGVVVALVYLVQILRDMRDLSRKAKDEGGKIIDGVSAYREEIYRRGFQINDLLSVFNFFRKKSSKIVKKKETEV